MTVAPESAINRLGDGWVEVDPSKCKAFVLPIKQDVGLLRLAFSLGLLAKDISNFETTNPQPRPRGEE